MSNTKPTSFWNFLNNNTIEIPIIQRDYAQGRLGKENLRKTLLADLRNALHSGETMKLDFVYGSTEKDKLNPLDGQQRLTTLWLLHWYIALRAGELNEENCRVFRKFTYETRVSSREFCQNLCVSEYFENFDGNDIVSFITKQTWFYSAWKQDPTIQAMLRMLGGTKIADKNGDDIVDGIEEIFQGTGKGNFKSYWEKLTQEEVIVFYHLSLNDFGLSDDLYIKMNARGKQLTSFENFKADLIGYITRQAEDNAESGWKKLLDAENGIPIKMDTEWTDIFWKKENRSNNDRIDEIYFAFLNRFFWNELFIAKNSEKKYILDIGKGDEGSTKENNNSSYKYFNNSEHPNDYDATIVYEGLDVYKYDNRTIPLSFFQKLKRVLDNYFAYSQHNDLPECPWDISFRFIPSYAVENDKNIEITNNANDKILRVSTLNQVQRIVFFAVCKYFDHDNNICDNESSLKQWMRVVWNLVSGEDQNGRPEIRSISAMRTAIEFINSLNPHDVYKSLKEKEKEVLGTTSFEERCKEEIAKAIQILNGGQGYDGKSWEEIIIETEKYAFFKGSIRFLFTKEKTGDDWEHFKTKWEKTKFLIPLEKEKRHTIKLMIQFMDDGDLKYVFSKFVLSNEDKNLKALLLDSPAKVYNFLMQQNKTASQSLLQSDLIYLCEQHQDYWIHESWVEGFDVLSNYERQAWYYGDYSYVIGNDFFIKRLGVLKRIEGVYISDNQNLENSGKVWKGLFIEFEYRRQKFRWQLNDWIDMYDGQMNNLWEKGLHSHYMGNEKESFKDAESLKNELDRLIAEASSKE